MASTFCPLPLLRMMYAAIVGVLILGLGPAVSKAQTNNVITFQNFDATQLPKNGDGDFFPSATDGRGGEGGDFDSSLNSAQSISGKSLQMSVKNVAGTGNALYAQFNPYNYANNPGYPLGPRAFARQYAIDSAKWKFNTINRLSFWIKPPLNAPGFNNITTGNDAGDDGNYNIGTYVKNVTNPDGSSDEAGGNHYYHSLDIPNGAESGGQWIRVIINMHPNHQRGGDGNYEWANGWEDPPGSGHFVYPAHPTDEAGANYFDALTRWYFQQNNANAVFPADFLLDEIRFYHEQSAENDLEVYSIVGVYNPANHRTLVSWNHHKDEGISHEVRYLIGPESTNPHAVGWNALTQPPDGRIEAPNTGGYNGMAYDTAAISLGSAAGVWIAIKPLGATLFSTIYLPNGTGSPPDTTPPGAPKNLRVN